MAKHDQRIQKFLNQNADRAPTITEMMTRLNISISDISDSLNSLLSQGLVAKRTNNQGIECWFPAGGQQPFVQHTQQPTQQFAIPSHIQPPQLGASEPRHLERESRPDPRYGSGFIERPMPLPEAQPPAAKPAPVHVQHMAAAERATSQMQSFSAPSSVQASLPAQPEIIAPPIMGSPAMYGFQPQPAAKGVGFLTFAVGLIVAVGFSTWLAGRLATNEIHKAEKNFVAQKALTDANTAFADFQAKTKTHITTLEDQVKKLTDQLATSQATTDSLKVAAVPAPGDKAAAGKAGSAAKTPAGKAAPVAKAEAPAKKEESAPKAKAGKKAQVAKASKASAAASALAKAAARGKMKKAMSSKSSSSSDYSSPSSSDEGSATAASYSDPSPSVPQPPGLDNQELPPPPSE